MISKNYSTIAIVTHGGPIKVIAQNFLHIQVNRTEDCGYLEFYTSRKPRLSTVNNVDF